MDALDVAKAQKKPLLILCPDMEESVMNNLVFNKKQGIVDCCVVTMPGFSDHSKNLLEDYAFLTKSYFFNEFSKPLKDMNL